MPIFSDIDDVGKWLTDTVKEMGFDVPDDRHGTVGMACAVAVSDGIQVLAENEAGPDAELWPQNRPRYKRWKERNYPESEGKTNFRTHQMLSRESLMANVDVTREVVTMKYGTGRPSENDRRKDPTPDTKKAELAHEQQREFYAIGEVAEDHVFEMVADALGEHLQRRADAP
jgi:hypothetical protein